VDIINQVMAPSESEVAAARTLCRTYEGAMERGEPAAFIDGRVVTMPDYRVAALVLARAQEGNEAVGGIDELSAHGP
jgi:citrate lyase beta subunit